MLPLPIRSPFFPCVLVSLTWLSLLAGCHKHPASLVAGTITFRGTPVASATVEASCEDTDATYVADVTKDGTYEFSTLAGPGLPCGPYRVAIKPPRGTKPSLEYQPPKPVRAEDYPNIPKRYHDAKTSGLRFDIAPNGETRFDFDMRE